MSADGESRGLRRGVSRLTLGLTGLSIVTTIALIAVHFGDRHPGVLRPEEIAFLLPVLVSAGALAGMLVAARPAGFRAAQAVRYLTGAAVFAAGAGEFGVGVGVGVSHVGLFYVWALVLEMGVLERYPWNLVWSLAIVTAVVALRFAVLPGERQGVIYATEGLPMLAVPGYTIAILASAMVRFREAVVDLLGESAGYRLRLGSSEELVNHTPERSYLRPEPEYGDIYFRGRPWAVHHRTSIYDLWFDYVGPPFLAVGEERNVAVCLHNRLEFPQWLLFRWIVPDGWKVAPGIHARAMLEHHFGTGTLDVRFTLTRGESAGASDDLYLDVMSEGRPTRLVIPVRFATATFGPALVGPG